MKVELAQNMETMNERASKLKQALEASANLQKQLDRYSSHKASRRTAPSVQLDGIDESIGEENGLTDDFERDEDATDINIS